jgi:peptidoglycan/xylan/chitin deacetylase (PgdA/CDA1 family)
MVSPRIQPPCNSGQYLRSILTEKSCHNHYGVRRPRRRLFDRSAANNSTRRAWLALAPSRIRAASCENVAVDPYLIAAPAALTAASGMVAYAGRYPASKIFGPAITHTNSPRKLAITFDDGPNPAMTPKLLDLLDRHKARATFFVIGKYARQHPELLRETVARGHVIGNHTDSHPNLFWSSPAQTRDELRRCHDAIATALQAPPKFFRPPFGWRNPWLATAARDLHLQVVTWTLLPGDWRAADDQWLVRRMDSITSRAKSAANPTSSSPSRGDILCLHDGGHRAQNADRTRTLAALDHCLPRWRDLGLEFVTMNEAVTTPA